MKLKEAQDQLRKYQECISILMRDGAIAEVKLSMGVHVSAPKMTQQTTNKLLKSNIEVWQKLWIDPTSEQESQS